MAAESAYHTRLAVTCDPELAQILIAETSQIGFDTFLENDQGFEAYAESDQFNREALDQIMERYSVASFVLSKVEKQNWNELWERSYAPIVVEDRVLIRAHFHEEANVFPYVITITPKMSFGTGHHQTTYLMVKAQLELDHQDKHVMDAGCGTAILSIFASLRGAKSVEAFDIDEWSVTNATENCQVNKCENVHVQPGKISTLTFENPFDIILSNINKNILLAELPLYATHLKGDGHLLMSGFYEHDVEEIVEGSNALGFEFVQSYSKENWAAVLLRLKSSD